MDWPWPALCAFYGWAQCAVTTRGGDAVAHRNDSSRYPCGIRRPSRSRSGRHTRVDTTPRIRLACPTTRCNSLTRTAKRSTQTSRRSKVGPWTKRRDHPGQLSSAAAHAEASETLRKWVWVGTAQPGQMRVEAMRAEGTNEAITRIYRPYRCHARLPAGEVSRVDCPDDLQL